MQLKTLLGLTALCTLGLAETARANSITVEALAREPAIRSVSMSAEGDLIVAIVAAPGSDYRETALATWKTDDMDAGPVVTPSGDAMKFIGANALKAGRIVVNARQEWTGALAGCGEGKLIGSTATFVNKSYLTDAKHSDFDVAFEQSGHSVGVGAATERCMEIAGAARLVNVLPADPENVMIERVDSIDLRSDYFLYNLDTDRSTLVVRGGKDAEPALFHPKDGQLLVRIETESVDNDYEQRYYLRNEVNAEFEFHPSLTVKLSNRFTQNIVGVDDETGNYYVLTDRFSNNVQARLYNPTTETFASEPLVAHPKFDIAGLVFDRRKESFNSLIGYTLAGPTFETTYVDGDFRSIHEGLKQAFPGRNIFISDYNDDLSRILFTTGNAQNPTAYHLLLDRKKVQNLGEQRPWIDSEDIGEQRWVTYPARDGLEIPAILDLPVGWSEKDGPLPTIIHPHGGPWARDYTGYDSSGFVPYLTSRGFAVLRPQYRGSRGLGRELWLAGDAEWGARMQDDKDDGAEWLVEQGIADPKRIAIYGYSYGGFAAAAAVVRPDSPYACAISGAPVTDLARLGNLWSTDRLQRRLQGVTVRGMDPMANTDKANIPVLLFVGSRDVRTPKWHAERFYDAVKDTVPARYELIPDMPHSLPWYPRHFETMFGLMEEFLEEECGFGNISL